MADMITRCPKCSTAFRISDTLIKSAKGVVRCGSCLSVFNAKEYIVSKGSPVSSNKETSDSIEENKSTTNTAGAATTRSMAEVISDLEQLAIKTQATSGTAKKTPESLKLKKPQKLKQPPKLKKPSQDGPGLFEGSTDNSTPNNNEVNEDDEAWALELLNDDSDSDVKFRKIATPPEDSHSTPAAPAKSPQQLDEDEAPTNPKIVAEAPQQQNEQQPDTKNTESSLNISSASSEAQNKAKQPKEPETKEATLDADRPIKNTQKQESLAEHIENTPETPSKEEPATLKDTIAAIELEPLDVEWQKKRKSIKERFMWPAMTAIALIALLGQIAWLQYYQLNQLEPYRSGYAVACKTLGCKLPPLKDIRKISTSNLLVRSHPDTENALMVDVILKNTAPFTQAFPQLRLTFTNHQSTPIATRKFTPEEYLGGELTGRPMPINQPIHIAIEIIDPSAHAVGYSIAIED